MTDETWHTIPGLEGVYEASNKGRIRCLRMGRGSRPFPANRIVVGSARNGYFRSRSVVDNTCLNHHRLVALAFKGVPKEGLVVRHLNGKRGDNRPENLEWGTPKENSADMKIHGTHFQMSKVTCPKGHPYSGDNLYTTPSGTRMCRICCRTRDSVLRARLRALGLPPGDNKHGSESGYKHHGCRCQPCVSAASAGYFRRKNDNPKH